MADHSCTLRESASWISRHTAWALILRRYGDEISFGPTNSLTAHSQVDSMIAVTMRLCWTRHSSLVTTGPFGRNSSVAEMERGKERRVRSIDPYKVLEWQPSSSRRVQIWATLVLRLQRKSGPGNCRSQAALPQRLWR